MGHCNLRSAPAPRFELKYRIRESAAADISRFAGFHLQPDEYSRDGEYVVNSLYFDTPGNRDAQETDEGVAIRSKVRLRCYQNQPAPPFFLELKQRFGSSIYKTRAAISPDDAHRVACGSPPTGAYRRGNDTAQLDKIREVIDSREMTPRVWVRYTREAWVSSWGDGVRMTFDRRLETQAVSVCDALNPFARGWTFPELDERTVLELKFFGSAPRWMQQLATEAQLQQTSCSKYGICLGSAQGPVALARLAEAS